MVVIRLARAGSHKKPFYHVVVADKRSPRDGRFIERIGFYNPIASQSEIYLNFDAERIEYWMSCGAQPSERVAYLLKQFKKYGATTKPAKRKKAAPKAAQAASASEETAASAESAAE